jgi:predicted DNA-binding transcriptional regulator AlpA
MTKVHLTVEDLAAMAGISPRQVWREVKRGRLPAPSYDGDGAAIWDSEAAEKWVRRRQGERVCDAADSIPPQTLDPSRFWVGRLPPSRMTVEDVARELGKSPRSVWRKVSDGTLPQPQPKPIRPRLWRTADLMPRIEALRPRPWRAQDATAWFRACVESLRKVTGRRK